MFYFCSCDCFKCIFSFLTFLQHIFLFSVIDFSMTFDFLNIFLFLRATFYYVFHVFSFATFSFPNFSKQFSSFDVLLSNNKQFHCLLNFLSWIISFFFSSMSSCSYVFYFQASWNKKKGIAKSLDCVLLSINIPDKKESWFTATSSWNRSPKLTNVKQHRAWLLSRWVDAWEYDIL